jgi:signal transduction histidine kinase
MDQIAEQDRLQETLPQMAGFMRGLSGKLLILTILFVMLAEVLIFIPSVSSARIRWLEDRLNTAAAASVVVDGMQQVDLPRSLQDGTLMATGTKAIILGKDSTRHLIAMADMPPRVDADYDIAQTQALSAIGDAFTTLFFGENRIIRVMGPIADSRMTIEVVLEEKALRDAMLLYARNAFLLSIMIALITAGLIFLSINRIMLLPIRKMTRNMQAFSQNPEDPAGVLVPEPGQDELAVAGHHLSMMQKQLQKTLRQQKNLADLGLAVSKINHDMRNILASAQLMSDRLADVDDPVVKRFAPKLLRTIDRAVSYSTAVLSYGKATEPVPRRRILKVRLVVEDVLELLSVDTASGIDHAIQISPELEIDADGEQLFRVIYNLVRNAQEALVQDNAGLENEGTPALLITISAHRSGTVVVLHVDDTGPGMPQKARENLFKAFRGSARSGGTGLGLAIARELVLAHGGTIALVEKATPGTRFSIEIPDRPALLDQYRARQ